MQDLQKKFASFAELAVRVGVNVQKGQTLVISCPVDCAWFARLLVRAGYDAGAREVVMRWNDDAVTRQKYLCADSAVFDECPAWVQHLYKDYAAEGAAVISVSSSDPENLKGVDPQLVQRANRATGAALKSYWDAMMSNAFAWCVISVPTTAWARKVFPGCAEDEAVDKLWQAIFHASRITDDPVAAWKEHLAALSSRRDALNALKLTRLHYQNSRGTDLTIELPEKSCWMSAPDKTKAGVSFVANMPTEEIFTLPRKDGVNGVVVASRPLVLYGDLVKDFSLTFKDGKIVSVEAAQGRELLERAITQDEGSSYLGEVALVPVRSPISDTGLLFYNTLFDENASCHLAFGSAYPCFEDADTASMETLTARGMNQSPSTHEDFMVGTADLSIIGVTADGREVPVFSGGNFAF